MISTAEIAEALDAAPVPRRWPTDEEIAAALTGPNPSCAAVARRLSCGVARVMRVRRQLGIAPFRRGRQRTADSWEAAVAVRAVAVDGGHLHWTGPVARHGTPMVRLGSRRRSAYRVQFRAAHLREADGPVLPTCEYPNCLTGDHLADRWARAIRHAARPGTTQYRGMDLNAVRRTVAGTHPLPPLSPDETRLAFAWMTTREVPIRDIADRLGVAAKTIERWRT